MLCRNLLCYNELRRDFFAPPAGLLSVRNMTEFEHRGQDQNRLPGVRELVFWLVLAIILAMGLIGLIVGVAIHEAALAADGDQQQWVETTLAIVILSAPVLAPAALFYMSVCCRMKMAALAMSIALAIAATGAFFGMLAATFYSEAATGMLLVILAVMLRVGHLNTCWYKALDQQETPPRAQFRRLDAGLAVLSLAIISVSAAWTCTWQW
ncbi:hypothetical protein Enr8_01840 [Blastopirellula retiformator]|uniref:Uncharacterized protein n=2 Tax=Blastopirellula retiformator TaxID=2527970 RepID=A0A5C5VL99_9BACT|nr:hypothetical protein Enr8_01840 [Blastopirellula retiformator]